MGHVPEQARARDGRALPEGVWEILRCPYCSARLVRTESGVDCVECTTSYSYADGGPLDLRLQAMREYPLTFVVGQPPLADERIPIAPLKRRTNPAVNFAGMAIPTHLTAAMLDRFPQAASSASMALDLGCGTGLHRAVCERAGFQWVGLDYAADGAPIWGDGHALPFADDCFDFVLTIAVLEHIRYPFIMLHDAYRVLKPGGKLIGTVAFLEPFHARSYYHHSDLGIMNTLVQAGFRIEEIAPHKDWTVLTAQATLGLFPSMPSLLARLIVAPVQGLHRLWWRVGRIANPRATEDLRLRTTTGAFTFVATKPEQPA